MKGFFAIMVIYSITVGVCAVVKILNGKYGVNNKSGENSPPKIYYISKARRKKETTSVIPIKSSAIEKEDVFENDYPF